MGIPLGVDIWPMVHHRACKCNTIHKVFDLIDTIMAEASCGV